jgi:hypothetical protein
MPSKKHLNDKHSMLSNITLMNFTLLNNVADLPIGRASFSAMVKRCDTWACNYIGSYKLSYEQDCGREVKLFDREGKLVFHATKSGHVLNNSDHCQMCGAEEYEGRWYDGCK